VVIFVAIADKSLSKVLSSNKIMAHLLPRKGFMNTREEYREVDWEFWLSQWLTCHRIVVSEREPDRWRAIAYDGQGEVLDFVSGKSRRFVIEAVCLEIGLMSFWEIHKPQSERFDLLQILA
jgi:hypothetical protein